MYAVRMTIRSDEPSPPEAAAPRVRRQYTAAEKAEYLALFAASDLSLSVFCREMALPEATLALWRRQAVDATASRGFAAVELVSTSDMSTPVALTLTVRACHDHDMPFVVELTGVDLQTLSPIVRTLLTPPAA